MSETKRKKERVDRAWNKLYDRLDADGLLLSGRQDRNVCLHPCCGSGGLWLLYGSEYVSF